MNRKCRLWDKKYNQHIKITPLESGGMFCEFEESPDSTPEQRILDGKTGKNIFLTADGHVVSVCPETPLKISIRDESDRYEIEYSTGLKDKAGVEIYEGDVIEDSFGTWYRKKLVITPSFFHEFVGWGLPAAALSVIGNIHENPELLGELDED